MKGSQTALRSLIRSRFQPKRKVRQLIDRLEKERKSAFEFQEGSYLTGTYRGQFYRIRVPAKPKVLPNVGRLRSPTSPPKPFTQLPPSSASQQQSKRGEKAQEEIVDFFQRLKMWFRENWNVMILNAGSVCTLIGFTRSDVLELRVFSATGSFASVLYSYFLVPPRYPPMLWSGLFALVNLTKIYQILQERKANVRLDARQEETYVEFFLQHGVTPKQFEFIDEKAKIFTVPRDTFLVKQGEKLNHVYLIVKGKTHASILGRRLTAASFTPEVVKQGGASGAWVGEMAFLEYYWNKEKGSRITKVPNRTDSAEKGATDQETEPKPPKVKADQIPMKIDSDSDDDYTGGRSFYNIVAQDDCLVMMWSHEDMEKLMNKSTDMRAALTRAMTSAIVGKVVNFTVSRSTGGANWMHWLEDWRYSDAKVLVKDDENEKHHESAESTVDMPIKKFS